MKQNWLCNSTQFSRLRFWALGQVIPSYTSPGRAGADSAGASFPLLHSRLRAWFPPAAPCALHTHRSRVTFSRPLYFVSTTVHKLRHTLQSGVQISTYYFRQSNKTIVTIPYAVRLPHEQSHLTFTLKGFRVDSILSTDLCTMEQILLCHLCGFYITLTFSLFYHYHTLTLLQCKLLQQVNVYILYICTKLDCCGVRILCRSALQSLLSGRQFVAHCSTLQHTVAHCSTVWKHIAAH